MLENYTETLVREVLTEYNTKDPICECPNCENDIVAMVLNEMAPMYFLSNASAGDKIAYVLNKKMRFEALIKISEMVPKALELNHKHE